MYTIGQFSQICRVSIKALRHYEKMGLLVPARVEPGNQYRYYTSDQVAILKDIILMKELGLSLKAIKQMIDRQEWPEEVAAILEGHRNHLLHQADLCNSRLYMLAMRREAGEVEAQGEAVRYDVIIKTIPEIQVASKRKRMTQQCGEPPEMIRSLLEEVGDAWAGTTITILHDEEFDPIQRDVEAAVTVSDPSRATGKLPSCQVASTIHVGPQFEWAFQAVYAWINEHGYQAAGPLRIVIFNAAPSETSPTGYTPVEKVVSEIMVPVVKACQEPEQHQV
jgi:DNA-binding transcriptional MerR regulator